jgi:predicted DNA repair protein MutK
MASSFFALLDDIAYLMDDVATMGKVATKKTAGILSDDLAVNAEKASGFVSSRELPVLWKITKGSILNKLIILPFAFLLSAFLPLAVIIILVIGGVYLAYEGTEKIVEFLFHRNHNNSEVDDIIDTPEEEKEYENEKVKGAILVDFILSIEIVIIALGTVIEKPLSIQIPVVSLVALIATVGVYGIVALIVRMDDIGLMLINKSNNKPGFKKSLGVLLVRTLPIVIRILAVVGTFAMILVAGGIFVHNIPQIHDFLHGIQSTLADFIAGLAVGIVSVLVMYLVKGTRKVVKKRRSL